MSDGQLKSFIIGKRHKSLKKQIQEALEAHVDVSDSIPTPGEINKVLSKRKVNR